MFQSTLKIVLAVAMVNLTLSPSFANEDLSRAGAIVESTKVERQADKQEFKESLAEAQARVMALKEELAAAKAKASEEGMGGGRMVLLGAASVGAVIAVYGTISAVVIRLGPNYGRGNYMDFSGLAVVISLLISGFGAAVYGGALGLIALTPTEVEKLEAAIIEADEGLRAAQAAL